jgi:hypothetical protein
MDPTATMIAVPITEVLLFAAQVPLLSAGGGMGASGMVLMGDRVGTSPKGVGGATVGFTGAGFGAGIAATADAALSMASSAKVPGLQF